MKVLIRTGRFDLLSSDESVNIHIKYGAGEAEEVLNLNLPIEFKDEFDGDEDEPWPDLARRVCERYVSHWWITSLKPEIEVFLAWLAIDENHDAMLADWARSLHEIVLRRRDRAQGQLDRVEQILASVAVAP